MLAKPGGRWAHPTQLAVARPAAHRCPLSTWPLHVDAFGLSRERVQDSVVVMRQQIKGDCVVKVRVGTVEPCPSLLAVHVTACLRDDRREDKELLLLALGWLGVSILPAFHG